MEGEGRRGGQSDEMREEPELSLMALWMEEGAKSQGTWVASTSRIWQGIWLPWSLHRG